MKYCINCANKLRENAKFCEKCGTPVNREVNKKIPPSPKKNNKVLIIVLSVIGVFSLIIIISFILAFNLIYRISTVNRNNNEYQYEYSEKFNDYLEVDNLSIEYSNNTWSEIEVLNRNEKAIIKDESSIVISVVEQKYTSSKIQENIIENNYSKEGYTEYSAKEKLIVNDTAWTKFVYTDYKNIHVIIIRVENDKIYKFLYTAPLKYYYDEDYKINAIYKTLKIEKN